MDIHKIRGEDHYQCREVKAERDMLKARLDDLKTSLAAAEADAERYRWLRDECEDWTLFQGYVESEQEGLAAAIDAARRAK